MDRPPHSLPQGRRAAAAVLAAGLAACATAPGIRVVQPEGTDRVEVRAPPTGWTRIAVVPFGGDPAHRRPAEELASASLQRAGRAIVTPFAVARGERSRGVALEELAARAERWTLAALDTPDGALPHDELRSLARDLSVDALVVGCVAAGGSAADLVVVDGATGLAVAAFRRAGNASAAREGVHALAMDSAAQTVDDVLAVLATAPGVAPDVRPPRRNAIQPAEVP